MSKLKSAYVTAFFPVLLVALAHSFIGITSNSIAWIGSLTTTLTIIAMFIWLFMPFVARTDELLLPFSLAMFAGVVMTVSVYLYIDFSGIYPGLYTAINAVWWVGYLFWYSYFNRTTAESIQVGEAMPQFFVEDPDGNPQHSSQLKGKIALYMFYRGNWCPMCMAQVREIARTYQELAKRGVEIALISPQSHANTQSLAKQYDVPFHFWVDTDNHVADILGIQNQDGVPLGMPGYEPDTVLPTVVITDENGEVIFVDETDNYRVRPEPRTFINILDTYLANKVPSAVGV